MSWWERREAAVDGPGALVGASFFITCKLALRATMISLLLSCRY